MTIRSFTVRPIRKQTYYDFRCPYCKSIIYKNDEEIKKYKWDVCYCGSKIIFLEEDIVKEQIIKQEIEKRKVIKEEKPPAIRVEIPKQPIKQPIKPAVMTKKYDDKAYISLLKGLGMKVGEAKVLIKDLIGMGFDPKDENLFTQKLLENMKG